MGYPAFVMVMGWPSSASICRMWLRCPHQPHRPLPSSRCQVRLPARLLDVATIKFDERDLDAQVPDLAAGGAWTRVRLRWRRDPLTGSSARILTGEKLQPDTRPDLTELTAKPSFCPFDSEHLEKATVPFPAELTAEGRIREGRAVVVPNIMAYATH